VRPFLLAAAALLLTAPASAAPLPQRFGWGCARSDFASGGTSVRAEFCRAPGVAGPAVVVLHGCGGFSTFDHRLAVTLPAKGISTLDVDYFGPTPPPGRKGWCGGGGRGADPFLTWIRVAIDAASKLRATPGVSSVGAVGWSLGGGVVVAAAAQATGAKPFDAVAGFSTGSHGAGAVAARLPPTILLSGGRTDAIPLEETLPLYRGLRAAHVPAALYVYPRGSHSWPGRQGTLGIERAASFLNRYLR
jgi:dienelactone hydrolase